jgi:sialidase-1
MIRTIRRLAFIAPLLLAGFANAAETGLRKVNLFEARTGGYYTYRIPGIAVANDGGLLAYCEARKTGAGDWEDIDIVARRSADGGATWGPMEILVDAGKLPAHNSLSIVERGTGTIHFLYHVNYARAFHMLSRDGGRSFTKPLEITPVFEEFQKDFLWNVIGNGTGHGIQLRSGRLVVPVWLSNGGRRHRPSVVSVIYSDDHGTTWKRGSLVFNLMTNMSETTVVELADGSVLLNMRSEDREHRRAVVTSKDGAGRWTVPRFDPALLEPVCNASLLRLTEKSATSRSRILFSNPDNLEYSGKHGPSYDRNRDRKNLTVKLSYDECQTWPVSKVLEPGVSAYSDLAAGRDGTIHCLYECDGVNGSMWDTRYVTLASFSLAWLTDGKDRLGK